MRSLMSINAEGSDEGRRARKARATRRALLDAGLAAFERQPISLVSVLDITESADVAKGVFYLQFASKDDFLIALWVDVSESFLAAMRESLARCRSLRARLSAAVGHYALAARAEPRRVCFLLRMSSFIGDELGEPGKFTSVREAYLMSLAATLIASDSNEQPPASAVRLAQFLDACCWGIIWQAMRRDEDPPSSEQMCDLILPAVSPLAKGLALH